MKKAQRCGWAANDEVMAAYHDEEWGVPERDSRALWEMLILEGFQAGLSWITILRRRESFRKAFKNFDPVTVAKFTAKDVDRLMNDEGIIRARLKIEATVGNAKAYLAMEKAGEDFSEFVWQLAGNMPVQRENAERLVSTPVSEQISKALKKKGFKFVGPVIIYAWMQAVGMVNDHDHDCFRFSKCKALAKTKR